MLDVDVGLQADLDGLRMGFLDRMCSSSNPNSPGLGIILNHMNQREKKEV